MKKTLLIVLTILLVFPISANAKNKITIRVNNQKIDAQAFVDKNNRTLVPLRFIADNLSATTDWNQQNKTATVTQNEKTITLCIPCKKLTINGEETSTDSYGLIQKNRIYVPLRLIAQAFGVNVSYKKGVVDINTDGSTPSPNPPKENKSPIPDSSKMKKLDPSILPPEATKFRREGTPLYDGAGWNWNVQQPSHEKSNHEIFVLTYTKSRASLYFIVTTDGKWIMASPSDNEAAFFFGDYVGIEIDKVLFTGAEEEKNGDITINNPVEYLVDIPNIKIEKRD